MTMYEFVRLDTDGPMGCVNLEGSLIAMDLDQPSNFHMVSDCYSEVRLNQASDTIMEVMGYDTGERYERMIERIKL